MANTIRHKRSSTTGATPAAGSLVTGELAVNTADGKLFTKKDSGTVVEIGGTPAGSTSQVQFNSSGVFAADDGLTFTSASETLRVGSGTNHLKLYSDAFQTFVEPVGGALRLRHPTGGYITIGDASATGSIGTGTNILVSANDASITNYAQLVWNRAPVLTEGVATFQANVNLQASLLLNNSQGTNGQVLTSTGSGVQWATPSGGGGGGGTKTYAVFTPLNGVPPATAYPTISTTANFIIVYDFDAATDETVYFIGIMPEAASLGSGLKIRLHWFSSTTTTGTCRWGVQLERQNTSTASSSFDTAATAGTTVNASVSVPVVTEITITAIDGIVAGDPFRLAVYRDADGTSGTDDMTGDARLISVEVRSAT
jgi:hypothetical protein